MSAVSIDAEATKLAFNVGIEHEASSIYAHRSWRDISSQSYHHGIL